LEGHSRDVPIPVLSAGKPDKNSHQLHTRRYCSSKKYFTIWVSQKYICDNLLWIDH
jgi:hypothetical protein